MINETVPEGFQKTEVGIIPNDWSVSSVGEEFDVKLGKMLDSEKNVGVPKFYLGNKSVQWNRIDTTDLQVMRIPRNELDRFRLSRGDLLVCEGGEVGRAALWENQIEECYFQKALHRLRPKSKFNTEFMLALLNYWSIQNKLSEFVTQTSIAHLTREKFLTVPLPVPPKAEQTAIANALNDADELITRLEKLIAKKRNIKQGAMQELLKPKDDWEVKKLGECLIQNPDYGINAPAVEFDESLPVYLRITDITEDGKYSKKNIVSVNSIYSSKYFLEKGDLVFARTGASVGKTYLYNSNDGKLVFAGFLIRVKVNPKILIPEYFQFFTQTSLYWDWIRSNSMRTGQPGINGNEYKELLINLPPTIDEQVQIAQILTDMDAEIEGLEKKLEKYKMLKQGMMQNLLTGKIRLV